MDAIGRVFSQMGIGSIGDVACVNAFDQNRPDSAGNEMHNAAQALIRMEIMKDGKELRRLLACAILNCDVTQTGKLYSVGSDGHVLCEEFKDPDRADLIKRLSGL